MTEKLSNADFAALEGKIRDIFERVEKAAIRAGRDPKEISVLAATKTVPSGVINHAIACGIRLIGENRVQELLQKRDKLNLDGVSVHFIGHLQTNKVKQVVGKVDLIQSVDSLRLAEAIARQSQKTGLVSEVLVEVNIEKELSKYGLLPEEVERSLEEIAKLEGIKVRGLMTIPPICDDSDKMRAVFNKMYKLFIDMRDKKIDNISMDILSMGMSADYEEAIMEGSTLIRLGTAIFGARKYKED